MIATAKRIEAVEEYYFSKKLAEVRSLDTPEVPIINLGIGSPDLAPPQQVINALSIAANKASSHGYQNYKGIPGFRQAIADFNNRVYGATLNPETEILPLMGSKEGIMHISMAFLNEGDEVLIPNPGYPTYCSVASLVGAKVRSYDLTEELNWQIDIEALRKSDLSNVKLMWINSPHMPTGSVLSQEILKELVNLAIANNFLLVNDNPYSLILNSSPSSVLSIEGAKTVALELNSLSKSHSMAGWRMGWVAGHKEYIEAILRVKSNMDSGMFLALQEAAIVALQNGAEWFDEINTIYSQRKQVAKEILTILGCTYSDNQSGLFVWAKVPDVVDDVEKWIDDVLYSTKVFITPGFIFGTTGKRFIRISLCATEDKLKEALTRIGVYLQSKRSAKLSATV